MVHIGSFYDGLRVDDAREFDLNVALDIEVLVAVGALKIDWKKEDQGFVNLQMERQPCMVVPPNHKLSRYGPGWLFFYPHDITLAGSAPW